MDYNEFKAALSVYLERAEAGHSTQEIAIGDFMTAPLNNFFGNDMLTLLYRTTDVLPRRLTELKKYLNIVSDTRIPRHKRAHAAIELGRFVRASRGSQHRFLEGAGKPRHWFRFAVDLNSIVGAWELANEYLAELNQSVEQGQGNALIPKLISKATAHATRPAYPNEEAAAAWELGGRVALRHVQRRFEGWGQEQFHAAMSCVVNWLTLWPEPTFRSSQQALIARRAESLTWIGPLWRHLIEAAPRMMMDPKKDRQFLLDQRRAIHLLLSDNAEQLPEFANVHEMPSSPLTDSTSIVVIRGLIPSTAERSETAYLKLYEVLQRPVPLTAIPTLRDIRAIQAQLEAEFPWASAAINVIISDLRARRRHGSLRLGMQPVLLIGPPGTGKTRFAQRLSDVLGTPNTVINLAGMSDVKTLKGVTRGWASNRPSRMIEFIQQNRVANPLFIMDEVDKAQVHDHGNGGKPHDALLDLLEPGNARRYTDIFLMTECDLSHCLYILTANSLQNLPEPLLSRVRMVLFPAPGPEHAAVIAKGILRDMESAWNIPVGTLALAASEMSGLVGLSPRDMKRALLDIFGQRDDEARYARH